MTRIHLRGTLLAAAVFGFATPLVSTAAMANDCPADKVGTDVMKPGAMAPKDVTDTVIATIDLGQGYNVDGRLLRMRKLVVQPGGIVPWHSHAERPANIYIVSGAITENSSPPWRTTTSWERTAPRRVPATSWRTRLPFWWPCSSLTRLKSLRSTTITASGRP